WEHTTLEDPSQIQPMVDRIRKHKSVGFDIESTGMKWWGISKLIGLGFGVIEEDTICTWYIPYRIYKMFRQNDVKEILESSSITKIGANIKFEFHWMRTIGMEMKSLQDVQIMARLLRSQYFKVELD